MIAKWLVGDHRHEHLFTLKQSLKAYRSYQKMLEACDREFGNTHRIQPRVGPTVQMSP